MRSISVIPFLLACCVAIRGVESFAASAPSFTITAANVTMPSGGNLGSSPFALTSTNGYAGKVLVSCAYSGGEMGAKVPTCGIYTNPYFALGENQTVTGTLTVSPYGKVIPFSGLGPGERLNRVPAMALAVACVLFLFRARLNVAQWLLIFAVSAIGIAGVAGCGGNGQSGTFPYTVTATDTKTNASVSTSITVTVP